MPGNDGQQISVKVGDGETQASFPTTDDRHHGGAEQGRDAGHGDSDRPPVIVPLIGEVSGYF